MKSQEKVYLIDTNVILRYLLGDHPEFSARATAFMKDVSRGRKKAVMLDIVTVECVYVLEKYYKIPRTEIAEKLSGTLSLPGIVNKNKGETFNALLKYKDSNIDIVDCMLAARSSPSRVVISFDTDFDKLKAVREIL